MREVAQADAFEWLPAHAGEGAVATSLPGGFELGLGPDEWLAEWMPRAAAACLEASTGPTVFVQTDRKGDGRLRSTAAPLIVLAEASGHTLLWHKVALRREPGKVDIHRPGFSHLLCFGPGRPGAATPDTISPGRKDWKNGTSINVALAIASYLAGAGASHLLNPFCGTGVLLAAAEREGLTAAGCELDPARAEKARRLRFRE